MGKMYVTFHRGGALSADRTEALPVIRLHSAVTEVVTTSTGASAKTTKAASFGPNSHDSTDGGMVTVKAVGANINVVAGPTAGLAAAAPVASPANGPGYPLMSGESVTFAVYKDDVIAGIEFV
ncbi:hypothetical protein EVB41_021 [Rhizobium phage RHph_TM3_14A]|nr:hypothetical protein EVB29_021 [Rhizobium phage RHph_TM27A]QIG66941.1 hypothetical protein EVB30_021 [Rhizobium phage RHph_TM27B]QIG67031.1 hypothetical protein EVB31_021 [Rhizobium phage RHph_TM29]QIG67486.1 hypothetical protein EVB41_021 [Rhizobium phage RHph_TM3_14A]